VSWSAKESSSVRAWIGEPICRDAEHIVREGRRGFVRRLKFYARQWSRPSQIGLSDRSFAGYFEDELSRLRTMRRGARGN